ncbi:MAG TPA: hypothetical protein VJ725_32630 [Thermoanaerobaculia bacterium]|nr:hypothetical protein [Thermoanaerobaculia bacterium]
MNRKSILVSGVAGLLACSLLAQTAPPQERRYGFRPEALEVEPHLAERAGALAATLGFDSWPRPAERYGAPAVGRALFDEPARFAEEVRSCTTLRFRQEPWDHCVSSWKPRGEGRERSAPDSLDLEITVTPDARAAQEFLLTALADNMMDMATLVKTYGEAQKPAGLGDVAFLVESRDGQDVRLSFTRANLVLRLRGYGALSDEVVPLARRLDERILNQQPLTLEQLRARQAKPRPPG